MVGCLDSFCLLVDWLLVGKLIGWFFGWLVSQLISWLVVS
jgi:hypothetical protein